MVRNKKFQFYKHFILFVFVCAVVLKSSQMLEFILLLLLTCCVVYLIYWLWCTVAIFFRLKLNKPYYFSISINTFI